ncbi:MAG: 3-isopropylmalate dehydratase small subunit [Fimbriimonadales bacterium]|nr:3-isopropylmalate dehydratase small subunit [Fimbriimonadales bacterium]
MEPFRTHRGKIAILNEDDVDTDRIIPARFLTMVTRSGYGELLFKDVRGDDFPLDDPAAKGASILVVGTNFGCGSSREHAVWAIQQAGFKAVVGKRTAQTAAFSDIFRQNSANNALLLVELDEDAHRAVVETGTGTQVEIDLPNQTLSIDDTSLHFDINPATKHALVEGLDLIGTTLIHEEAISRYEQSKGPFVPTK